MLQEIIDAVIARLALISQDNGYKTDAGQVVKFGYAALHMASWKSGDLITVELKPNSASVHTQTLHHCSQQLAVVAVVAAAEHDEPERHLLEILADIRRALAVPADSIHADLIELSLEGEATPELDELHGEFVLIDQPVTFHYQDDFA